MMFEKEEQLPLGWVQIELIEIMCRTRSINPSKTPELKYELWSVPAFPSNKPEYIRGKDIGSNKQLVQLGDVLLCKINPRINRVWLITKKNRSEQIASTEWIVLRCIGLYPKYIMYHLREENFRNLLCSDLSGVGGSLTRARPRIVGNIKINIAPIEEQKRIVEKIEQLQAHSRRAKETLETIPDLLEKLRQSILTSAFRGDLTRKWREEHPETEPASKLLKRIRIERRKRWEAVELDKLKAKGLTGEKLDARFDKRRKQYKEPEPLDTNDLPDLPEGWCWASWDLLTELITSGLRGWANYYSDIGSVFIRAQDIKTDEIILDEVAHVKIPKKAEGQRTLLKLNDLLITITGANVTISALVREELSEAYVSQHVALIRPVDDAISSIMHLWSISTAGGRGILLETAYGGGKPGLNLDNLRSLYMPLPPKEEIAIIVKLVDYDKLVIANIKERIDDLFNELVSLDQSIFFKAFNGKLVPQNPNDEPASMLIERIRLKKTRLAAEMKPKQKRRGKKMKGRNVNQKEILTTLQEAARAMTPEELFAAGGFCEDSVDAFYKQIRAAVNSEKVRETRKGTEVYLEALS